MRITLPRTRSSITAVALAGAALAGTLSAAPAASASETVQPAATTVTTSSSTGTHDIASGAAASPLQTASWVRRNCGITTCSWYFSRAKTRSIKSAFDTYGWTAKTAASRLCRLLPHVGAKAACTIAVRYHYRNAHSNTRAAYNRGGCVVVKVRAAYMSTPALSWKTIKFDNVPLSNRYCDAS
ncbi:hypothetical protein GCM10022226_60640 [Sphaerisporangium flaviroseum]|uniref:Peptidase inhibitor family I36 protein n=1 Tax=Sphaerisporangium flaviroseum TaxID=509199 RepID=A0ABP7J1L2_9ACTN